jgi:hypothetical protein
MAFESCFKDFILIKQDNGNIPESGLYINVDLPITLDMLNKIKEADQADLNAMWDEIQDRGIKKFIIRVKQGYRELFGVCSVDEDWLDTYKDDLAMALLYYLGSELMIERIFSTRINRYTTIDKNKAIELKQLFDDEFPIQLKAALEIIHGSLKDETGEVFTFREVLP